MKIVENTKVILRVYNGEKIVNANDPMFMSRHDIIHGNTLQSGEVEGGGWRADGRRRRARVDDEGQCRTADGGRREVFTPF